LSLTANRNGQNPEQQRRNDKQSGDERLFYDLHKYGQQVEVTLRKNYLLHQSVRVSGRLKVAQRFTAGCSFLFALRAHCARATRGPSKSHEYISFDYLASFTHTSPAVIPLTETS